MSEIAGDIFPVKIGQACFKCKGKNTVIHYSDNRIVCANCGIINQEIKIEGRADKMKIVCHISPIAFNHKPSKQEAASVQKSFVGSRPQAVTPKDLAVKLISGYSIIPFKADWSRQAQTEGIRKEHWTGANVLFLDFDNKDNQYPITHEDVLRIAQRNNIIINFIYSTFSSDTKTPKFRVVIALDEPISSLAEYYFVIDQRIKTLFPQADSSCLTPYKLYFGGRNLLYENYDGVQSLRDLVLVETNRNDTLLKFTCKLRQEMSDAEAEQEALKFYNRFCTHNDFGLREAQTTIKSAMRYEIEKKLLFQPTVEIPLVPQTERKFAYSPMSKVVKEKTEWLIPNLVPKDHVSLIQGNGGIGKSFWALKLCATVTRGSSEFGYKGSPKNILFCSFEETPGLIKEKIDNMDYDEERFICWDGTYEGESGIVRVHDIPELERAILNLNPEILVLDSLTSGLSGKIDTNKFNEVGEIITELERLAVRTKTTILAMQHINKGSGRGASRGMGSMAFISSVRSCIGFTKTKPQHFAICQLKTNLCPDSVAGKEFVIDINTRDVRFVTERADINPYNIYDDREMEQ